VKRSGDTADANLLLYAAIQDFAQHDAARSWLDERLNGTVRVGFPWSSLLAFVRIASSLRMFERPASVADAWQRVTDWLGCAPLWIVGPTEQHREILDGFLRTVVGRAPSWCLTHIWRPLPSSTSDSVHD
jgi:predicted nucleic acid-binding protein